ncbi:MAG: ferrous iron transport protein A [Lachnospiraceae bacterium]|nr:ferrous iron transport protein A [Lachnospiraceae bacterium]
MMPLTFAVPGEANIVKRVGGNDEVRKHLADLGFVVGSEVAVVTSMCGNVIVNVKDSRIAISEEMARRIMV